MAVTAKKHQWNAARIAGLCLLVGTAVVVYSSGQQIVDAFRNIAMRTAQTVVAQTPSSATPRFSMDR